MFRESTGEYTFHYGESNGLFGMREFEMRELEKRELEEK
jgi:hypothetical protein